MKTSWLNVRNVVVVVMMVCSGMVYAQPVDNGFVYEGYLTSAGNPANGMFDFGFELYDAEVDGNQVGPIVDANDVDVVNGEFSVTLDFGDVFNGEARWLASEVEGEGDERVTRLEPRQKIMPTPYALYALKAGGPWVSGAGNTLYYNNGDVSIGTTEPQATLEVKGSSYFLGGSGDVSGNGSVSATDASCVAQYLAGSRSFSYRERAEADINGDGRIDTLDAELIAKVAVGNITLEEAHHSVGKFISDTAISIDYDGNVGIGTMEPEEKLHVIGNAKIVDGNQGEGKVLTSDASGVASWQTVAPGIPTGVIVMWSGASIPGGWALCDGTNGTPDLRNRFVVGAGDSYSVNNTGGEALHTLTIAEMPSHTHNYDGVAWQDRYDGGSWWSPYTSQTKTSTSTGGGQPHNNLPPYYALAYIMKL